MKLAVCSGGQLRMSDDILKLTTDLLKDAFPCADFYWPVWREDYEKRHIVDTLGGTVEVFEEYDIDYHPYEDNRDAVNTPNFHKKLKNPNPDRHLHQTKQILNHNTMMKKYLSGYDVIVRTRYDAIVSPVQNFTQGLEMCYNDGSVVSYQAGSSGDNFMHHNDVIGETGSYMVSDGGLIFHRADVWDCDLVDRLHKTKKLLAAEFGWYQALVSGDRDYYHFRGGAHLTRCVMKQHGDRIRELMK